MDPNLEDDNIVISQVLNELFGDPDFEGISESHLQGLLYRSTTLRVQLMNCDFYAYLYNDYSIGRSLRLILNPCNKNRRNLLEGVIQTVRVSRSKYKVFNSELAYLEELLLDVRKVLYLIQLRLNTADIRVGMNEDIDENSSKFEFKENSIMAVYEDTLWLFDRILEQLEDSL